MRTFGRRTKCAHKIVDHGAVIRLKSGSRVPRSRRSVSPLWIKPPTTACSVVLLNSWVGLCGMSSSVCKTSTSCPVLCIFVIHLQSFFQECSNLRITREVGMSDVVWFYLSWEFARRFKYQSVIEHFDLYFRSLNVVGSVAASVDRHLLNDELWIVTLCHKLSMLSQECMLANLSLDKLNRLLNLIQ